MTSIKQNNKIANYVKIKQRVRRGYVLSMNIFPCYSEIINEGITERAGIKIDRYNMNNMYYADNTIVKLI